MSFQMSYDVHWTKRYVIKCVCRKVPNYVSINFIFVILLTYFKIPLTLRNVTFAVIIRR